MPFQRNKTMNNYDTNPNQLRNNAARQSFSRFTDNIADSTARAMNYANPVTFTKNLWNAAGQLPETLRKYDADYGRRVREDLYGANQSAAFPTPMKTSRPNKPRPPGIEPVQQSRNHPPQINTAPVMKNKPADVSRTNTNTNKASVYGNQPITPSNWRSSGKRYNDLNTAVLLDKNGYPASSLQTQISAPLFDNTYMEKRYAGSYRPRTEEERIREGRESYNRILRGTKAMENLRYYKQHGKDMPGYSPGYNLNPDPVAQQQQFENELSVRRLGLDIQKRNDSLHPVPVKDKFKGQFSDIVDDNFNITGQRFDGSFNESTGEWLPANQATAPVQLNQEQFEALNRARQLSSKSDSYTDAYLELLMALGLDPNWYLDYEE